MRSRILSLRLNQFRSYAEAELECGGRSVFLHGENGSGKTNLLEAISLLGAGRGLRGAALGEIGRRPAKALEGVPWAVAGTLAGDAGERRLGVGFDPAQSARRMHRLDGEPVPAAMLGEHIRPMWLTPAQDRLFLGPASERRRFFDRLVYAARSDHAVQASIYERGLRERGRLLADAAADPAWLTAVERAMAASGAKVAIARAATAGELEAEIAGRAISAFPRGRIELTGAWERMAQAGASEARIAAGLGEALASGRALDAAAGRALAGPHRGDLEVVHADTGRAASQGSTGEQKALILGLVLAQAARLSRASEAPNPILLLDEVAAHLDAKRRGALFDEIEALALQAFLTGTDERLFDGLRGRALGARVRASVLELESD